MKQINIKCDADPSGYHLLSDDIKRRRHITAYAHCDVEDHITNVMDDNDWEWRPPDLINFNVNSDDIGDNGVFKASCYGRDVYLIVSRESVYIPTDDSFKGDLRLLSHKEYEAIYKIMGVTSTDTDTRSSIEWACAALRVGATHISWDTGDWFNWHKEKENAAKKMFGEKVQDIMWWVEDDEDRDAWAKDYELKYPKPDSNYVMDLVDYIRRYNSDEVKEKREAMDDWAEGQCYYHYTDTSNKCVKGIVVAPHQLHYGLMYLSDSERCVPVNTSNLRVIHDNGGMKEWPKK